MWRSVAKGLVYLYDRFSSSWYKYYYILVQGLGVTCFFTGQYNTKGYDTITGDTWRHVMLQE